MKINELPPSTFCKFPFESVLKKTEAEIVAVNMMKIRRRLGDNWPLTWEQYAAERRKDGGFSELEKGYFKRLALMIPDAVGAIQFCAIWAESARVALGGD